MINHLTTETRNQNTMKLDDMSTKEFLHVMNKEDQQVPLAVEKEIDSIENAIRLVVDSFNNGGRLIYIGAGTSGRLGILDAVECRPTFGIEFEKVRGIIAGGDHAIIKAVEGAEDKPEDGATDLKELKLTNNDTVIGLAASGRTPYVLGGLQYAKQLGAHTISVACNKKAEISRFADIAIEVVVGPEVITGSTRLKSGTAQKLIVNMISTGAMVGIGKVYENLMVDMQLTNQKLVDRAKNIIALATGVTREQAEEHLKNSLYKPKVAIVMIEKRCSMEEAETSLQSANGFVREAIRT
ncbi:N-acetylmuramic acid 6-phosphate etherase [Halobacillus shinanisalinarum]|uniref:N-acetylmuramic acid 6-phosphate etherase n=1 Tax=Halobacillus shinanisalinarum TaxID=2932258 RepID=A0ABY4GXR5_9BACI|nr:N-acetylmuramic acid 6-phosphate etherase [Halobacillus shinanisalinarum]UOQ92888.1 N-acetylmuramic acid 6-phosphate etherase [Halobacillus shinanisalinarum]